MGFYFAFELNDNFVYFYGFVIKSYYYLMLGFVLFVVPVHFVYMSQKDLNDK